MGIGGVLEFFGGIAIMLGLGTRPVAFILSGMMAVAYWQFHAPNGPVAGSESGRAGRPVLFPLPVHGRAGRGVESGRAASTQTQERHERSIGALMGKVTSDMSMSLDGFIAGPNDDVERPLGDGGDRLHQWVYDLASWRKLHGLAGGKTNRDADVVDESCKTTGAVVMGRRMFNLGERYWGDNPPFHVPVFVVTHDAREKVTKEGGTTFTFVTDGIESALSQAKADAGEKDVSVAGGAKIVQQYLTARLLEDIQIHLVPVLPGEGRPLFDQAGSEHI